MDLGVRWKRRPWFWCARKGEGKGNGGDDLAILAADDVMTNPTRIRLGRQLTMVLIGFPLGRDRFFHLSDMDRV
jgi:hypothetical protein